jgi:molybdate transport system regulatory protein
MELSARNKLQGTIEEIVKGAVMAKVKVNIGGRNVVSSLISVDSVDELNLKVGDNVYAIVKSTEVMIGK